MNTFYECIWGWNIYYDKRPSQEWIHACGQPHTAWIHQICCDTGVTATEALELVKDRPFWQKITTSEGFG